MDRLIYRPIRVATDSEDEHGVLAMLDGKLLAVLVRLDAGFQGVERRRWHHEAGFGRFDGQPGVFETLEQVTEWIAARAGADPATLGGSIAPADPEPASQRRGGDSTAR